MSIAAFQMVFVCFVACSAVAAADTQDSVCGPRAAKYVVEHYGLPSPDLVDCINEMGLEGENRGVSLDQIQIFLKRRGVHSVAIKSEDLVDWAQPVVVHLNSTVESSGGHIVVLLPSQTSRRLRVWDGVNGVKVGPSHRLPFSGYMLLTSLEKIDLNAVNLKSVPIVRAWWMALIASIFFLLVAIGRSINGQIACKALLRRSLSGRFGYGDDWG